MAGAGKERRQGRARSVTRGRVALAALSLLALTITGCPEKRRPPRPRGPSAAEVAERARREEEARIDREYPLHGLARSRQLRIVSGPDRESGILGWLRRGARVRAKREVQRGPGCSEGWYEIHPRGFTCKGTDMLFGDTPPDPDFYDTTPALDAPLPYDYFFVSSYTAQYFRRPTDVEWRAAVNYVGRYRHFSEEEPDKLERFKAGELRGEPTKPEVVFDVLPRGYFVASPHRESREGEQWARSVQGRWIALGHLTQRRGSSFHGFRLDDGSATLPIAVVNRPAPLERAVDRGRDGIRFVDDDTQMVQRYQVLGAEWRGKTRLGDYFVHRIGTDRFLKEWYVSVIQSVTPDFAVADDEVWFHVDLSEQTLVAYRGRTPFFGTLVSTGLPGHETIRGRFRIERKFVGSTMDNLGPEAGANDYRIEDVPWTQYFRDDIALHAAFWHDRFGVARSHGCVNLSPIDAHMLFGLTRPTLPAGWHGIPTRTSGETGTTVWITP